VTDAPISNPATEGIAAAIRRLKDAGVPFDPDHAEDHAVYDAIFSTLDAADADQSTPGGRLTVSLAAELAALGAIARVEHREEPLGTRQRRSILELIRDIINGFK